MKCPVCTGTDLMMTERLGIEIDYCPQCRGIWLDRGELDKIIERSLQVEGAGQPSRGRPAYQNDNHNYWERSDNQHHDAQRNHDGHGQQHHEKKSFWRELFD